MGRRDGAKKKKDSWTWTSVVIVGGGVEESIRGMNGNGKIQ